MKHWIDLGIHTEAYITQPDTVGAAGTAMSFWMYIIQCNYWGGGLITSRHASTGFQMLCYCGKLW